MYILCTADTPVPTIVVAPTTALPRLLLPRLGRRDYSSGERWHCTTYLLL